MHHNDPTVLFVHGVGLAPSVFTDVARLITQPAKPPALAITRHGYDGTPLPATFVEQVDALVDLCERNGPCVVVGVSGGATLALAAATRSSTSIAGVVTHEPLVGALEPELHATVTRAARSLALDPAGSLAFIRSLYGPETWAQLADDAIAWTVDHLGVVPADVAQFVTFAPSRAELGSISCAHVTTVGANSAAPRHRIADLLADCGAQRRVVTDAGHLVAIEQPVAFAEVVNSMVTELITA